MRLDDPGCHRSGRRATVTTMFDDDRYHQRGLVQRRPAHEQRVVTQLRRKLIRIHAFLEADNLGGSGLSRHRQARESPGGAGGAVHRLGEGVVDQGQMIRVDPLKSGCPRWRRHHVRCDRLSPVGEKRERPGELDGGGQYRPLTNRYRYRLARVPRGSPDLATPFGGADEPRGLEQEINASSLTKAETVEPFGHSLDAQALTEEVEVDIAGLCEGALEVDESVTPASPTSEPMAVKNHRSIAIHGRVGIDQSLSQAAQGEERFDGRARGVDSLQTSVLKWMKRIFLERLPVGSAQPAAEHAWVETRRGVQNPHGTAPRIESHHGAGPISEGLGGGPLKSDIESKTDVMPGSWGDLGNHAELPAHSRNHNPTFSCAAGNEGVFSNLDTCCPNHGVGLEPGVSLYRLLGNRLQMPNNVGREFAVWVMTTEAADNRQFRVVTLVGSDGRDLIPAQILADDQWRHPADSPLRDAIFKGSYVGHAGLGQKKPGGVEVLCLVGEKQQFPARNIFCQNLATAIVDPTPRSWKRETAEAIVLSKVSPLGPVHELEVREAQMKEAESSEDQQKEKCRATTQWTDVLSQLHNDHRSLRT